ncbi:hypothetical protein TanjilG_17426 [Lupinus angustifolius]|uniref:C3H1-type domain-containing protein n=1 Tax=Lupinus angustifolius TaxID=3871 RepID=A0A4P1R1I5_LUPAN|nr:PREDICTED: zinc finger CCCH domain-containing protein 55-like [Lupinus angustifolius]OIV99616.1 hypothetical protein TanjilG_17426 [Lupinus angustifolius]
MDTLHEATNVVIIRLNNLLEPENASKIIGHILVNFQDIELIRLASSPDYVLHSLILRLKTLLGLSSPNPIPVPVPRPRVIAANPFSRFNGNHPSLPGFTNNPIRPKFGSFVSPDHGSVSKSCLSPRVVMGGECDLDEQEMRDYISFLRDGDLVDPKQLELGHGVGDSHFRRTYSTSDVCVGSEQIGFKPCLYFARGFCKNGRNCKFLHSDLTKSVGSFVGSPPWSEGLEQREEFMRLKGEQQQRLMAMAAEASPSSHDKYIHFLMQRQHDPSSNQIYLTFPSESTFKDQDVSEYFSTFGPVKEVRIPYQKKRMFGFVTFVHPETVRFILSKGNPHYICDSRVLVKPYKAKGDLLDKRQQHQQQQLEREEFSSCLNSRGLESHNSKEPNDFHLGARMFYDPHEISLRKLTNLHLSDLRNNPIRRGASMPLPHNHDHVGNLRLSSDNINGDITGFSGNLVSSISLEPQQEVDPAGIHDKDNGNGNESTDAEIEDIHYIVESVLPDSLSASPTKAAGDDLSDFSTFSTSLSSSLNKLKLHTTFGNMTSH